MPKQSPKKNQHNSIIVFSAHSDDFVLGAGGSIAKYVADGRKVRVIIFSSGERSHPWLRPSVVRKFRLKEAVQAGKILGCKVSFLGLPDQRIKAEFTPALAQQLRQRLQKIKPEKIFTHSSEDPHPDHRAVHQLARTLCTSLRPAVELYTYSIWNPVSFRSHFPTLYVDISSTFGKKMEALQAFPSQRFNAIYPLMILVLKRAFFGGMKIRKRFAENFYRIQ